MVTKKIQQSQQKQKHCYGSRNRAQCCKNFAVGDVALSRNLRARGLNEKYVGPYSVIDVNGTSSEIELLDNKKKKVVHEC